MHIARKNKYLADKSALVPHQGEASSGGGGGDDRGGDRCPEDQLKIVVAQITEAIVQQHDPDSCTGYPIGFGGLMIDKFSESIDTIAALGFLGTKVSKRSRDRFGDNEIRQGVVWVYAPRCSLKRVSKGSDLVIRLLKAASDHSNDIDRSTDIINKTWIYNDGTDFNTATTPTST